MPRGGARAGAGRPVGRGRPKLDDFLPVELKRKLGRPSRAELRRSAPQIMAEAIARESQVIDAAGITEALIRRLVLRALACLRYHTRRGNLKAAMYLVDRCIGAPQRPFAEEVLTYTEAELQAAFVSELERLNLPPAVHALVVARFVESCEVAAMEHAIIPALGPHGELLDADCCSDLDDGSD